MDRSPSHHPSAHTNAEFQEIKANMKHPSFHHHPDLDNESFLLQRVQPGLSGLMDGSLSTLAPIFAVVLATHRPLTAFYTGLATALGAGVSMAFSEGLSDTGEVTGRGSPVLRGAITGGGTFLGGVFHTLPFLISSYHTAIVVAIVIVAVELLLLAWLRHRFFRTSFVRSFISVALGGAIIASLSAALGIAAAS
jgi:erythrin-vacuolar iron transport family protein